MTQTNNIIRVETPRSLIDAGKGDELLVYSVRLIDEVTVGVQLGSVLRVSHIILEGWEGDRRWQTA